jgi:hypothetical protein
VDNISWFSLKKAACPRIVAATFAGAQTERRGDAGPVRSLLGGKAAPADFSNYNEGTKADITWIRSALCS